MPVAHVTWQVPEAMLHAAIDRYGPMIHARCERQLPPHLVEEAVQAVFLVYARRGPDAESGPDLAHYLMRTCSHVIRNARRDEGRRRQRYLPLAAQQEEQAVPDTDDIAMQEVRRHLDDALERLPTREREALALHYFAGHSCAEIGRMQGCPASTVVSRVQRGLQRLRARLQRRGLACSAGLVLACCQSEANAALPAALAQRLHQQASSPDSAAMAGAERLGRTRIRPRGYRIMMYSLVGAGIAGVLSYAALSAPSATDRPGSVPATTPPPTAVTAVTAVSERLWVITIPDLAATVEQLVQLPEFQLLPPQLQQQIVSQAAGLGTITLQVLGTFEEGSRPSVDLRVAVHSQQAAGLAQQLLTPLLRQLTLLGDGETASWQLDDQHLRLHIGQHISTDGLSLSVTTDDAQLQIVELKDSGSPALLSALSLDLAPAGSTLSVLGPKAGEREAPLPATPLPSDAVAAARWRAGPWLQPTLDLIANLTAMRLSDPTAKGRLNITTGTTNGHLTMNTDLLDADGTPIQTVPNTRIDDAIQALFGDSSDTAWAAVLPNTGLPSLVVDVPLDPEQAALVQTVLREELDARERADGLHLIWDEWLPIHISSRPGRMRLQMLNTQPLPDRGTETAVFPEWASQFQMQVDTGRFMQDVAPLLGLSAEHAAAFDEQPPTRLLRGLDADGRMQVRLEGNLLVAAYAASAPLQALVHLADLMKNDG